MNEIMKIAFAGLRHNHVYDLYQMAKENTLYEICGAFENNAEARVQAENRGLMCNYQTYESLLDDPKINAVVLGGCYGDRGLMAIKALRAGKHVIADKPLCTSVEELNEIELLANQTGKLVGCMFTMRYAPKIIGVKKLVESGALGEINNVYFGGQHPLMYGRRPAWYFEDEKHGGVINDIAIHGIDILSYAFGLNMKSVCSARCWNKYAGNELQFKDSGQFMLVADNDAGILADVSYSVPDGIEFALPYYWQFYVWGTKGTISFSINEKESFYYLAGSNDAMLLEEKTAKNDYLTDFYNLVKGKDDCILTMEQVFRSTRTTLEIQTAAL